MQCGTRPTMSYRANVVLHPAYSGFHFRSGRDEPCPIGRTTIFQSRCGGISLRMLRTFIGRLSITHSKLMPTNLARRKRRTALLGPLSNAPT